MSVEARIALSADGRGAAASRGLVRWALLLFACIVAVAPARADGEPDVESTRERNRRRLRDMTPAEVASIRKNLNSFDDLTDLERNRLRRFHEQLSSLQSEERLSLEDTMKRYVGWLGTLTPAQRREVDSADSPSRRLEVVRRLIAAQKEELQRDLSRLRRDDESERSGRRSPRPFHERYRNENESIASLESQLRPKLSRSELDLLAEARCRYHLRFPKALALTIMATDHDVSIPPEVASYVERMSGYYWDSLSFLSRHFGVREARYLEPDRKMEAQRLLLQFMTLPELDLHKLYEHYETLDEENRRRIQSMYRRPGFRYALVHSYYRHHPESLPEPLADVFSKLGRFRSRSSSRSSGTRIGSGFSRSRGRSSSPSEPSSAR